MMSTAQRRIYLQALGIPAWELRSSLHDSSDPAPLKPAAAAGPTGNQAPVSTTGSTRLSGEIDWPELVQSVESCTACELASTRTQTVFGTGNRSADWLFVGEAPGADEDKQGEPFVGRAGQLLNAMLFALGLKREDVYIANILKCRPPDNRDPRPEEVSMCEAYLRAQIDLIKPEVIIALGRHAAHNLLRTDESLSKLRGQSHDYHGTPLVVTYHPAYLLRTPGDKSKTWQDLCRATKVVNQ